MTGTECILSCDDIVNQSPSVTGMGKTSDLELFYYRTCVTTSSAHHGPHRIRGGSVAKRRHRPGRRGRPLRAQERREAAAMAFMMRKKRFKFQVELTLDELTEVALDKATLLAKVRQLDGGSFTDVSEK